VSRDAREIVALRRLSIFWVILFFVQFTLGAWTIWSNKAADIATAHVAANVTNLFIMESVRRHYKEEYEGLVTSTLGPEASGDLPLPPGPGLGVELSAKVLLSKDAMVKRASL